MALLELIGRLGLNTQPFESGLKNARTKADSASRDMGRAFSRVGLGLLGISSVGGAMNRIVSQTIQWSRDIDAAREEFKRLGIEIDEGALRSIKQTGIELDRLKATAAITIAPIISGVGNVFSMAGSSVSRLINRLLHPLTPGVNDQLDKDIASRAMAIYGNAGDVEAQGKFSAERLAKMAKEQERVKKVAEPIIRRDQDVSLPPRDFGSLARVGGFGMVPSAGAPAQRHVEQIAKATQETAQHTREVIVAVNGFRQFVDRAGFWKEIQIEP